MRKPRNNEERWCKLIMTIFIYVLSSLFISILLGVGKLILVSSLLFGIWFIVFLSLFFSDNLDFDWIVESEDD